jgi:hypothetical protein
MTISPRAQSLLDRVPKDHPLSAPMRDAVIAALAAGEQFAGHKIALQSDDRMTPKGRSQALRDSLTQNHGKQWARAKAPVAKARKEITSRRDALTIKALDPTNFAAALERQEIRAWVRQLDLGIRQSVVLGSNDKRILEAIVSAPPELSGFDGSAELAGKVEARYFELVFPDELAAIEAMDAVVSEAEAAMGVAYNDLRIAYAPDMHPRDFDDLMKPAVETIKPWLIDGRRQVCETGADGKPTYRKATEADLADGVEYKNYDEYKAAQGLAA